VINRRNSIEEKLQRSAALAKNALMRRAASNEKKKKKKRQQRGIAAQRNARIAGWRWRR